ncbi:MAG: TonB-dependent receptor, partial [Acidobacteria bacterium]|nr:TonB-dependent receptor [Acidobacteriota bacterium]
TLGGPLLKERLTLLQSFQYRFVRSPVTSLPETEQDTELESFDSFTQLDATFNPNHRLTLAVSFYPQKSRFANLNTFNPQEVAANYRQRGWMAGLQDRWLLGDGSLLESTFSLKEFDVDIFPARPGHAMVFRPERVFGSSFNTQNRITRRTEWLEVYSLAPRQARGQHLLRVGFGLSRNLFRGFHESNTVLIKRADGTLAERIDFFGPTEIGRNQTEYTLWLQDKWTPVRRVTFDLGLRYDYDTLAHRSNLAPRLGFALLLTDDNRTLLRGGVGLFYDKVPLNVGTFEQLQDRLVELFPAPSPVPPPFPLPRVRNRRAFFNRLADIENPRSLAFNLELDRELAKGLLLRLGYLQREGRHEYIVDPQLGPQSGPRPNCVVAFPGLPAFNAESCGNLLLAPSGRSRYWETQVTLNYNFREDSFLNVSYVHSKAAGNLNNFQEFFGDFENPIIRPDERSRLRHDAPDRLILWGETKLLYGVRWAPVLDLHSGFPFSHLDETQNFVGARNQGGRLPVFASFDSQVWKDFRIKFRGKKRTVRIGLKVFNIFDHFNPRDVQQNLDAVNPLGLFNSRGRLFRGKFSIEY